MRLNLNFLAQSNANIVKYVVNSLKVKPALKKYLHLPQNDLKGSFCNFSEKPDYNKDRVVYYNEVANFKVRLNSLLIDVREHDEVKKTGKIPLSIHIPAKQVKFVLTRDSPFMARYAFMTRYNRRYPNRRTNIIFYCNSGNRSEKVMIEAMKLGYENVRNYKGGWQEWAKMQKKKMKECL